jgi:hypothetical protein
VPREKRHEKHITRLQGRGNDGHGGKGIDPDTATNSEITPAVGTREDLQAACILIEWREGHKHGELVRMAMKKRHVLMYFHGSAPNLVFDQQAVVIESNVLAKQLASDSNQALMAKYGPEGLGEQSDHESSTSFERDFFGQHFAF